MAEHKNLEFERPGGYAMPKGATQVQRRASQEMRAAAEAGELRLFGDRVPPHAPLPLEGLAPAHRAADPDTRLYVGDCRDVLAALPDKGSVDLVFADPPFNWDVPYESWKDGMPRDAYERFTFDWLDGCVDCLAPHGSIWVNIPDDTAAEIVLHLKRRGLTMINWCVWHFRFGQNRDSSFIMSKVHALYFAKSPTERRWNAEAVMEPSDRATIYGDARTMEKDENKGKRVPMDVWYGPYWGRVQGNNSERRALHHNQLPEVYLERVILACSNEGDLVLDPFCGSGTTSTVARAWGRRSITIEHSEKNAASAWDRIATVGMLRKGKSNLGSVPPWLEHRVRGTSKDAAAADGAGTSAAAAVDAAEGQPTPEGLPAASLSVPPTLPGKPPRARRNARRAADEGSIFTVGTRDGTG